MLQQLKPLHPRALPRPKAPLVPQKGAPWLKPDVPVSQEPESPNATVRANIDRILTHYAVGDMTLDDIGKTLEPLPLTGLQIRHILMADRELRQRLEAVNEHRAHHLFELAARQAVRDGSSTDLLRIAERMLPKVYGPKAELSVTSNVKVEGELSVKMTPSEAYLKLIGGSE